MKAIASKIIGMLFLAAMLASCTFSFLEVGDISIPEDQLVCTITDIVPDGKMYSYSTKAGVLQYYVEHYYTAGGKEKQQQKYSSAGVLQYSYLYEYDAAGNQSFAAYYDATNTLGWYRVSTYTGALVESIREFNGANALQWTKRYSYGTDTLAEKVLGLAAFDGSDTLTDYTQYEYTTFKNEIKPSITRVYGKTAATVKASSRALVSLTRPTTPTLTIPAMPDAAAYTALGALSYTYYYYDENGESEIVMDKDWYPQKITRTDGRVAKPVSMQLTWGTDHRISRKSSYYGTTLALDVALTYDSVSGYPTKAVTTGAMLLLPLEYEIIYDTSQIPTRLNVSSDGKLLQWFEYKYTGPSLPLTLTAIRSVDPFAMFDELVKAQLEILHYNGDNILLETFQFLADGNNIRLNVLDAAKANAINGYYLGAYDVEGRVASLTSHSADGTQLWSNSYSYADAIKLLDANIPEFGRLVDTYLTNDMANYAQAFVMDMLF